MMQSANAQTNSDSTDTIICQILPVPELIGGIDTIQTLLRYPASHATVEGRVIVQFNVYADGRARDTKVLKSLAPDFDAEALRVVSLLRFRVPEEALQYSMPISTTLPVTFRRPER